MSYSKKNLGGTPEIMSAGILTSLLFLNLLVINAFLAKVDFIPFLISNSRQAGIYIIMVLIIILSYFRKKKRDILIKKYYHESQKEKRKGNIFVIVYIIFTILLTLLIAFFKPGYLPSI